MFCDVYINAEDAGALLFVEEGSGRFQFLDELVQRRFAFWRTIEFNIMTRPNVSLNFQANIVRTVFERGYCIIEIPGTWIKNWQAGYEERRRAAGVADDDKADGQGASEPAVEYIRPEHPEGARPVWA